MRNAFIAMPYNQEPYETLYKNAIHPALAARLYTVVRLDHAKLSRNIDGEIQRRIDESDLVVALVGCGNANVYFEIGWAAGRAKEMILIAEEHEELPFDTRQIQHLRFRKGDVAGFRLDFEEWVERTISFLAPAKKKMRRGEVFEAVVDAALFIDSALRTEEDKIWDEIKKGALISPEHSYSLESGAAHWLRLCSDPAYQPYADSMMFLRQHGEELIEAIGDETFCAPPDIVSLGPGDGRKEGVLLRQIAMRLRRGRVDDTLYYYPIDVSHLLLAEGIRNVLAAKTLGGYQAIFIKATWGNFDAINEFRPVYNYRSEPNVFLFLGNTFGNLPSERAFLRSMSAAMNPGDSLVLEVRAKTEGEQRLYGREDVQLGLSFGPLARLGVNYDPANLFKRTEAPGFTRVEGAEVISIYHKPCRIRGQEVFHSIMLSCVKRYDVGGLRRFIECDPSLKVIKTFDAGTTAFFVVQKANRDQEVHQ